MINSLRNPDPFIVISATVEAEIAAPGILAISSAVAGEGKTAVLPVSCDRWPAPGTYTGRGCRTARRCRACHGHEPPTESVPPSCSSAA